MPARVVLDKCPPGASEVERATELIASGLQGLVLPPTAVRQRRTARRRRGRWHPGWRWWPAGPTGPQRDLVSTVTVDDAAAARK